MQTQVVIMLNITFRGKGMQTKEFSRLISLFYVSNAFNGFIICVRYRQSVILEGWQ